MCPKCGLRHQSSHLAHSIKFLHKEACDLVLLDVQQCAAHLLADCKDMNTRAALEGLTAETVRLCSYSLIVLQL
jgi:hypothetical protein